MMSDNERLPPEVRDRPPLTPGAFPFTRYLDALDIWEYLPMDQGGRLVQLAVIGSERDADIARAVRRPGFFDAWGPPGAWDVLEKTQVEKSVWLNRWYFLPSLARVSARNGDRDGVRFLTEFVQQWWRDNPVPGNLTRYFSGGQYLWRDMQVAWRTLNLIWCYFLLRPELDGDTAAFLRHLIDAHARVLLAYFGDQPLHENNHQSHGALAMLSAGVLFPGRPEAAELIGQARRILEHHLEHAFFADGNSVELCPGYFPFIISIFRDAWLLCEANGIPPLRRCRERLAQWRVYLTAVAQPDGTTPPVNDSTEVDTKPSLAVLDAVLGGTSGTAASLCLRASGQAVMRSRDWYAFLDAGDRMLWHWHGGKLGFHLCYAGEPMVVDGGVCDYDDSLRLSWFCTPRAHNTLLVDGRGDRERVAIAFDEGACAGARLTAWESCARYDFATLTHEGFPAEIGTLRWIRHAILLKDCAFLLVDRVLSPEPHDYRWIFHFAARAVAPIPSGFAAKFATRNLALRSAPDTGLAATLIEGRICRNGRVSATSTGQFTRRAASTVEAFCFAPVEDNPGSIRLSVSDPAGKISVAFDTTTEQHRLTLPALTQKGAFSWSRRPVR